MQDYVSATHDPRHHRPPAAVPSGLLIAVVFGYFALLLGVAWWTSRGATIAGYTYEPLLGLDAFGILFRGQPRDRLVPLVCVLAPLATFGLRQNSPELFFGYQMGFEILIVNGTLTLAGLWLLSLGRPGGDRMMMARAEAEGP